MDNLKKVKVRITYFAIMISFRYFESIITDSIAHIEQI